MSGLFETITRELRLACRSFLREPGFAVVSVGALALGMGGAVAIFSVYHSVLVQPLPFAEPERLVSVWEKNPDRNWYQAQVAAANYLDWREQSETIADMAAYFDWLDEVVLDDGDGPSVALASTVTGNFFDVMGIAPLMGSGFEDAHTWDQAEPCVVLAHGFWSRHFGADNDVVGTSLVLDDVSHRVLGIMPPSFSFPFADTDLWLPVAWDPTLREREFFRRAHGMRVVGRLDDGATPTQATAEIEAIAARLEADYPGTNQNMGAGVTPLQEWIVGDVRLPLSILMAAVVLLLLIACANVSNMLLARMSSRLDEFRVKTALGSPRHRLVLQGLTESFVLAVLGGGLGVLLGTACVRPLLAASPDGFPRLYEVSTNLPVLLFAIGLTFFVALVFGSVPAWRSASATGTLGGRNHSQSRGSRRATGWLVASEVALTFPLVVGSGLMLATLTHLSRVETGFDASGVVVTTLMLPSTRYEDSGDIARFYRQLHEELEGISAVESVAMSSRLPFGNQRWSSDFTAEGWSSEQFGQGVRHDEITPNLFRTMGVPLISGRDFTTADAHDQPPVVIINETLAETYFPGDDPIGKRVVFDREVGADSVWRTIIGVVGNVRREALSTREKPSFYAPVMQETTRRVHILARSTAAPEIVVSAIRERLRAVDPSLPLFDVTTLEQTVSASLARERYLVTLLTLASAIALALASIGIYGVVSHATSGRTREISVRMALGARAGSVMALVLRSGLGPVMLGIAFGAGGSAVLATAMSSLLYGVRPLDPWTFALVALVVLSTATLACAIPARRATRVDRTAALRTE